MSLQRVTSLNALLKTRAPSVNQMREAHKIKIPTPNRYFKSWKDVPDEFVKVYSERDPHNLVYQSKQWMRLKKKQFFMNQDPNVWSNFTNGPIDFYAQSALAAAMAGFSIYFIYEIMKEDFSAYRLKAKQMRETPLDWKTPKEYIGVPVITPEMVGEA
ncbi:uncharacterized protein LOC141854912 [Brevipalpus obovatus]|uniref:uncharacterized protein LOC141854912 n=1 Tax=Brevipalpus obovatus TaxID=246614 RepID=UPI003D9E5058